MALTMPAPGRLRLDLELDDEFESSQPVAGPSSPSRPRNEASAEPQSSRSRLVLEEDDVDMDESLPSVSQLLPRRPAAFSVTTLDLADRPAPSRIGPLHGRTLDGKVISFARRPAKRLVPTIAEAQETSKTLAKLAMSMLEQPMHRMLDNIAAASAQAPLCDEPESLPIPEVTDVKGKGKATTDSMWTDRYRPRLYTDLIGDDRVHRTAMGWLKEWDTCVFKTAVGGAVQARKKALAKKRTWIEREENKENLPEDPYGRPNEKLLLLCGPPGLGKTTLAHVLARQAGYQVLEINASDDRSAKVVHERIRAALESTALTIGGASSTRPTCVIIDEIDGATGGGDSGFIRTLVRLVQDGSNLRKPKKGKKGHRPLLRPIICVCNDLYAPALRPLRPMARIVRFTPPTNVMVVRRLSDICTREELAADVKSLNMLVDVVKGDMRSCLNTLQFIKSKTASVDETSMRKTVASLKDSGTSATVVWDRLFKLHYNRKGAKNDEASLYVTRLARDVQTCGEYDKLAQGCFENYLSIRQPTEGWPAVLKMLDWLSFYDQLDKRMKAEHTFDLLAYAPFTFVAWHPLFASVGVKSFDWPKVDYENYVKRQAHQEIADTLAKSLPMTLSSLFNGANVAVELAPLVTRILSPDLRPVNAQLVKAEERAVLNKLVKLMATVGFAFIHEKGEDGQLSYRLEPPIDVFVHYDGKRAADVPASRYGLRSVVAKELEAEALRKADGGEEATTTSAKDYMTAYRIAAKGAGAQETHETPIALDFFGRTIAAPPQALGADDLPLPPPAKKVCVTYKHHEGFSNAVRLNIKIGQLFRMT